MENEAVSKNFIEQIIEKDLAEGHCETVKTRFPTEENSISALMIQIRQKRNLSL